MEINKKKTILFFSVCYIGLKFVLNQLISGLLKLNYYLFTIVNYLKNVNYYPQLYLPFLLNSYQVECRESGKPADQEYLRKQEELLLENYSS